MNPVLDGANDTAWFARGGTPAQRRSSSVFVSIPTSSTFVLLFHGHHSFKSATLQIFAVFPRIDTPQVLSEAL